jgi:hypothetical protein
MCSNTYITSSRNNTMSLELKIQIENELPRFINTIFSQVVLN